MHISSSISTMDERLDVQWTLLTKDWICDVPQRLPSDIVLPSRTSERWAINAGSYRIKINSPTIACHETLLTDQCGEKHLCLMNPS